MPLEGGKLVSRMGPERLGVLLLLLAGLCLLEAATAMSAAHTGSGRSSRGAAYGMEGTSEEAMRGLMNRNLLQSNKSEDLLPIDKSSNKSADQGKLDRNEGLPTSGTSSNKSEDVNKALWRAASHGDMETVMQALLDGADINTRQGDFNNTPLLAASRDGYNSVVDVLLNKTYGEADVNATDRDNASALFISSQYGHAEVVKALLDAKAFVDASRSQYNDSPLFIASQNGHQNVVRELLEAGANVSRHDAQLDTALHVASEMGHLSVVQTLLENGADPTVKNIHGNTPLHYACATIGDPGLGVVNATAGKAIETGDVDVLANDLSTPLIWASWFGNADSAELLVRGFNASTEFRNLNRQNVSDLICGCLQDADNGTVIQCPEGGCQETFINSTRERLELLFAQA